MNQLPRGTVTFLFTDVEGSTSLLQRHPRAYPEAIALHHSILRGAVDSTGGAVFETVGDAAYASFARADDAARAAANAQRELAAASWKDTGPLRVRMALHTGDVELSEGHYFGPALYRCARLMALGHGGQVLVSAVTAEILRDQASGELGLLDLGEHRLKDLLRGERVFQLTGLGLARAFPPLRGLDEHPHNLPLARNTLLGREREIAELRARVVDSGSRLTTLTGPGGVGKTRLALELAAQNADRFVDGAFFVPLARVGEISFMPAAVADAMSLRQAPGRSMEDTLRDYLHRKNMLIILDNFEHLIEGAPFVGDLLLSAPGVTVIVTSREALRLTGEREFAVQPLRVDEGGGGGPLERTAAVELFIERARDVQAGFDLSPSVIADIAEICRRLDGLPLAIELAAARARVLAPSELLARLELRLPMLVGGARDAPPRQRTIREAIDWSHDLLSEADREVFRRLAVFNGGCSLADAQAVLATGRADALELVDRLQSLVVKSLVRFDGARFSMLAVIREYAGEMLGLSGEKDDVRLRHAEHYARLVAILEPQLRSGTQLTALARIDAERDNVTSALGWCASERRDVAVRLCASMCWYWFIRSRNTEAQHWLGLVRPMLPGATDGDAAEILAWSAFLASEQGRLDEAAAFGEAGLEAARRSGDPTKVIAALMLYMPTRLLQGEPDTDRLVAELIEAAALSNDAFWLSWVNQFAGEVRRMQGREDESLAHDDKAIEFGRACGDRLFLGLTLINSAHIHLRRGRVAIARDYWREGLRAFDELGNDWGRAYALIGYAAVDIAEQRVERAAVLLAAADAWFRNMGINIQPTDRVMFDGYLGSVRGKLDATRFEAAWREGQHLSIVDAVAFATGSENGARQVQPASLS